jgi:very-short-patch-repair endonuclease
MAAVLACGPGAVLSHRSAADLHELRATDRSKIDATLAQEHARIVHGVDVHRSRTLTPVDVTHVDGIPCTTVARTLLDLAAVVPGRSTERAIEQAEVQEVLDYRSPERQVYINPGDGEPAVRVDFAWRAQRLVVETDGGKYHRTRAKFESDRRKDQRLALAGWRVLRITWRQLRDEPERIVRMIRRLLTQA